MDAFSLLEALKMGQDCWNAVLSASFCLFPFALYRKWVIFALMMAVLGEIWSTFKGLFAGPYPNVMGLWMFLTMAVYVLGFAYISLRVLWWIIEGLIELILSFCRKGSTPVRRSPLPPRKMWASSSQPVPMKWNRGKSGDVMYYFMDFYISAKNWSTGTSRVSQHFNEEVNRFKDWGNETMWYSYLQGILSLGREDILVIFMPCATRERYMRRWEGLATYLHEYGLEVGLNMVEITSSREIAHFSTDRGFSHNYELHIPEGKVCVILDDVRTTGRSCNELARTIRQHGSEVIGAVVMAQVPKGSIPYTVPEI